MKDKELWEIEIEKYDREAREKEKEYRRHHVLFGATQKDLEKFINKFKKD